MGLSSRVFCGGLDENSVSTVAQSVLGTYWTRLELDSNYSKAVTSAICHLPGDTCRW